MICAFETNQNVTPGGCVWLRDWHPDKRPACCPDLCKCGMGPWGAWRSVAGAISQIEWPARLTLERWGPATACRSNALDVATARTEAYELMYASGVWP
jgi:hypothetical protein